MVASSGALAPSGVERKDRSCKMATPVENDSPKSSLLSQC